jgi:hypothetical protein
MNGRNAKKYRKIGKQILVEWLHSVIPDDADKTLIDMNNLEEFLSDQTHIYLNRKFLLSAYSLKWIYKRVKRNPDLTLKQLQRDLKLEQGLTQAQTSSYFL